MNIRKHASMTVALLAFAVGAFSSAFGCASGGSAPEPGVAALGGGGPELSPSIAPRPVFGPTVRAATELPPISGGTLLVTSDGTTIASDPDRDVVYVVDTAALSLRSTIALQPGDEPGRLAEDGLGRVHVALRGGGALVTFDPSTGAVLARRPVCPAPRGLAWEASSDLVWVACATGELVAFPSAGGAAVHSFVVERDLRDVVVQSSSLVVTEFRSAQVLRIAIDGTISRRDALSAIVASGSPQVAWRTIAGPRTGPLANSTITVHQVESTLAISTNQPGGYSGFGGGSSSGGPVFVPGNNPPGADVDGGVTIDDSGVPPPIPVPGAPFFQSGPIVTSAVTILDPTGVAVASVPILQGVLAVDVALSPNGTFAAVALAGNGFAPLSSVQIVPIGALSVATLPNIDLNSKQVVAVAFDGAGKVLAQTREPAGLFVLSATQAPQSLLLSANSPRDTGHDIFHTQAGGLIACASCHPEGGDDGHVWLLDGLPRRTPSLRGTIAGTAPYHWPGDEMNMSVLLQDVYSGRMSGAQLDGSQQGALTAWVEGIPAPPAPSWVDPAAAKRGQALFDSAATGCKSCHLGPKFTNNSTVDVGTGHDSGFLPDGGPAPVAFQVPPLLGVGWRTPLFHDGCAATILDRFGTCSTAGHGATSQLSQGDISDLTAYLETL